MASPFLPSPSSFPWPRLFCSSRSVILTLSYLAPHQTPRVLDFLLALSSEEKKASFCIWTSQLYFSPPPIPAALQSHDAPLPPAPHTHHFVTISSP